MLEISGEDGNDDQHKCTREVSLKHPAVPPS